MNFFLFSRKLNSFLPQKFSTWPRFESERFVTRKWTIISQGVYVMENESVGSGDDIQNGRPHCLHSIFKAPLNKEWATQFQL